MRASFIAATIVGFFGILASASPLKPRWSEVNDGQLTSPPLGVTVTHGSDVLITYHVYDSLCVTLLSPSLSIFHAYEKLLQERGHEVHHRRLPAR